MPQVHIFSDSDKFFKKETFQQTLLEKTEEIDFSKVDFKTGTKIINEATLPYKKYNKNKTPYW